MLRHVDGPSKDRYRRKAVEQTPPSRVAPTGGLVGRLAGGTLVLVVLGTAVVGLMLGVRTSRLYARFEQQVGVIARNELAARLRAIGHELITKAVDAEARGDWASVQSWLPSRAAVDPELLAVFITDADGLVVADADPTRNGRPLADERLRSLLHRGESAVAEVAIDGKPGLVAVERGPGGSKLAWVIASATRVRDARLGIAQLGHDSVRFGWILVGLAGFVIAIVALGVVVLVGGSITRRLQTVSWRIGQLGRGDRSTHLVMDGPAELRQLGSELDLAARRLGATEDALRRQSAADAVAAARLDLVKQAMVLPDQLGALSVSRALPPSPQATAAGQQGSLLWMIEIVGDRLDDLFAARALSAAAAAIARKEAIGPAELLRRLDAEIGDRRARAIAVAINGDSLKIASAAARFPLLRRAGKLEPLVVRGDRLGELEPARGAEISITLKPGEALFLVGDGATREGHVGKADSAQALAQETQATVISLARS
jgi:hypothetical protein